MSGRVARTMASVLVLAGCQAASPNGVVAEGRLRDAGEARGVAATAPASAKRAIRGVRCGTVWDPERGAIADGRLVFDGDQVAAIGAARAIAAARDELDLRPLFCMPGLVDAHAHLTSYAREGDDDSLDTQRREAERNARLTLDAGVTSVRDLGAGGGGVDLWLRERIARGETLGPRMQRGLLYRGRGEPGLPRRARCDAAEARRFPGRPARQPSRGGSGARTRSPAAPG